MRILSRTTIVGLALSIGFCFASVGCTKAEPPTQYHGSWEIDQDDLVRGMSEAWPDDSETHATLRERLVQAHRNAAWIFSEDGSFTHDGSFPVTGRYILYQHGSDWVVLRLYIDSMLEDDQPADYDAMNAMTPQAWVTQEQLQDGPAPLLIGFQFLAEDQMREFSLLIRDGKITDGREENILFNRVD